PATEEETLFMKLFTVLPKFSRLLLVAAVRKKLKKQQETTVQSFSVTTPQNLLLQVRLLSMNL
ncbi:MAG: hypothetical protein K2G14_03305, partial [Ruminococcus sp.]|nr:hypothetical protein [Ruminococcus sp.]